MHVYLINVVHFTDQPPAYPSNDKPSDYNHDVFPHKTAKPPPVDISAVLLQLLQLIFLQQTIFSQDIMFALFQVAIHIPVDAIFDSMIRPMLNSSTTTATIWTPENRLGEHTLIEIAFDII